MTEFKGRLRIAGKEVDGSLEIPNALKKVKGIGINLADSISKVFSLKTGTPVEEKIGNLSDEMITTLEEIIADPAAHGIPEYMINRRKDPETGTNKHFTGSDLVFVIKQDKETHMAMKSWKGVRYAAGLPVRGQRTRTMGRKGKTMGVHRKKK